jgi:glycerol-3-phosphate cytidylyltransferase
MFKEKMIYCFDLDETLCFRNSNSDSYKNARPDQIMIDHVNKLYSCGNKIVIFTARGSSSGINWKDITENQLLKWGVSYSELIMGKPSYDIIIDDKAINSEDYRKKITRKTGFVASSFDLLHAGHCLFLKEARENCDYLIAAIQEDPTIDDFNNRPLRSPKNKPIQSIRERLIQLDSCKYVDEIVQYKTEGDLERILKNIKPSIRFLGSEYIGVAATGQNLSEEVFYHERNHNYSSSNLRKRIHDDSVKNSI